VGYHIFFHVTKMTKVPGANIILFLNEEQCNVKVYILYCTYFAQRTTGKKKVN
jgi:hypothetical protein